MRSFPLIPNGASSFRTAAAINLLAACLVASSAVESLGAEPFSPYRARVAAASAAVHSGPGDNFYATDTLAEGELVDVYRQQANGWCAIRPPEGSFSWVFERHVGPVEKVEMRDQDSPPITASLAEIDKPDVASRIGSRLNSQRNAVQVRLKKGEVVRVLGEEEIDGQKWYKISPPAGEFRWIHTSHIHRVGAIPNGDAQPPSPNGDGQSPSAEREPGLNVSNAVVASPSSDADSGVTAAAATAAESTPVGANTRYPGIDLSPVPAATPSVEAPLLLQTPAAATEGNPIATKPNDAWRAAPEKLNGMVPSTSAPVTSAPATTPPVSSAPATATPTAILPLTPTPLTSTPPAPTSTAANTAASAPAPPSRTLAELELRLSRMVADPPAAWNIEPLDAEAKAMLANAATPSERSAVQSTLTKIDRFATIARRYRETSGIAPPSAVAPDGSRFDAVGVLRPVNSRRPGAPPFALVDEKGQVLSFVTPTAGMNLQPLVGQRIGVMGNRGFIPEFQRAHVVAGRAAPVAERTLR